MGEVILDIHRTEDIIQLNFADTTALEDFIKWWRYEGESAFYNRDHCEDGEYNPEECEG